MDAESLLFYQAVELGLSEDTASSLWAAIKPVCGKLSEPEELGILYYSVNRCETLCKRSGLDDECAAPVSFARVHVSCIAGDLVRLSRRVPPCRRPALHTPILLSCRPFRTSERGPTACSASLFLRGILERRRRPSLSCHTCPPFCRPHAAWHVLRSGSDRLCRFPQVPSHFLCCPEGVSRQARAPEHVSAVHSSFFAALTHASPLSYLHVVCAQPDRAPRSCEWGDGPIFAFCVHLRCTCGRARR